MPAAIVRSNGVLSRTNGGWSKVRRLGVRARWAVPAGVVTVTGVVIAAAAVASADAAPSLPPRTAAQLLADVAQGSKTPLGPLTATVQETSDLGLPSCPRSPSRRAAGRAHDWPEVDQHLVPRPAAHQDRRARPGGRDRPASERPHALAVEQQDSDRDPVHAAGPRLRRSRRKGNGLGPRSRHGELSAPAATPFRTRRRRPPRRY